MENEILTFSQQLNVAVSATLLVYGLILATVNPRLKERFLWPAFLSWLIQWAAYLVLWLLSSLSGSTNKLLTLAFADVGTVSCLGFTYAFLNGTEARTRATLKFAACLFAPLLLYNASVYWYILHSHLIDNPLAITVWTTPSQIIAVFAYCSFAGVFLLRYGSLGLPMASACVIYAYLQRPGYLDVFQTAEVLRSPWMSFGLAAGKTVLGAVFYSTFFEKPLHYEPIRFPFREFGLRPSLVRGAGSLLFVLTGTLGLYKLRRYHGAPAEGLLDSVASFVLVGAVHIATLPLFVRVFNWFKNNLKGSDLPEATKPHS